MEAKDLSLEIATKIRNDGLTRPTVYSPEALKVLSAEPIKTAWGWDHGRPVYNRLPMVSEAYQKSYDVDQAQVYLDPTIPIAVGPGTLEVVKNQRDWRILDVQSGTITWEHGELSTERLRIDTSALDSGRGLQDGVYQVGYRLKQQRQNNNAQYPGFALAYAEERSLSDMQFAYDVSGDTPEHRSAYAINDNQNNSWWPNDYHGADSYITGTHYTLDLLEPTQTQQFTLRADEELAGANLAYYASEDAILWRKREQITAVDDVWTVDAQGDDTRYHRFFFWDGNVSINKIDYTGFGNFRDNRVLFDESVAEPFIENMYDVVEGNYILLAVFTVRNSVIQNVDDKRRVTYEKYQPVSDWITKFSDEQLKCRFRDVLTYSINSLAPPSANFHHYDEMDDSICWGLGNATIGALSEAPVISYPTEIELIDPVVEPTSIDHVLQPISDGHIATPPYAQTTLQDWSMDNGLY